MWRSQACQTLSKALGISSATAPDLLKALVIISDTTVRRSKREDQKPYWESEKRSHFSRWSTINPIIYKFFKDFNKHRKKTNRVVVFSCRPFTNILYWDIRPFTNIQWDCPIIWNNRLLMTNTEQFSWSVWKFRLTIL